MLLGRRLPRYRACLAAWRRFFFACLAHLLAQRFAFVMARFCAAVSGIESLRGSGPAGGQYHFFYVL